MLSRRNLLLTSIALAAATSVTPALAFEFQPYDKATVDKLIASGKPVVIHVYAFWCLQCHAQENNLNAIKDDKTYDDIAFFRVNYDGQQDVVKELNCPRSTLIAYKDGKEQGRMSWDTTQAAVVAILGKAL